MAYQINIANREINPRVINFFTFENQVTTLEFTLDSYMYDEVDLRNYKAYAVTSIKGSVDMTELEMNYDEVDDKLNLKWNVGDYTLTQEGAIVYQITFKQNEDDGENSAVWYSYKAIMINRGSVDADHQIVAEYPTIMKQWLDKMDALEGELINIKNEAIEEINKIAAMFDACVVYIPYGETISVEDRLNNRLYYQYTNEEHTNGRLEDCEGTILSETDNVITNCLTAVPQRIKYTVENNRLIIQTGSVIIVPYGTEDLTAQYPVGSTFIHENFKVYDTQFADGKFFVWVEVLAELKNKYSGSTSISHVFANINIGSGLTVGDVISNTSGDTDTGTGTYRFWYDTANNLVKKFEDDAVNPISDVFALPLMVAQSEVSVGWKSIDQVFNGFGYIGSTIWADKGVRGLIPNGRNIDGTLKNIEFTTSKVSTTQVISGATAFGVKGETGDYVIGIYGDDVYDEKLNIMSYQGVVYPWMYGGSLIFSNNVVTSLNPKLPFRAADHHDVMLKQDKATAVNYDNITNCITEIPQDIKLELVDGSLTLKAGSKVYVPNGKNADGSNKFDEVVIAFDFKLNVQADGLLIVNTNAYALGVVGAHYSGASQPTLTGSGDGAIWYNTSENKMYRYNGSTWESGLRSLPIGKVTTTSIDQVFNGFGYIGSTIFALPGVKGLIPNGRNEDGSLRNVEFTTSKVLIYTNIKVRNNANIVTDGTGISPKDVWLYDEETNLNFGGDSFPTKATSFATWFANSASPYNITSFTPKLPFHAVDRNDSSWIAQQAMPGGKYIDLTVGASGTTYTAPANGWYNFDCSSSSSSGFAQLINGTSGITISENANLNGRPARVYVPCSKDDSVSVYYENTSSQKLKFIYAEGEE